MLNSPLSVVHAMVHNYDLNQVGTLNSSLPYSPPDLNKNITEIFGKLINIYRGGAYSIPIYVQFVVLFGLCVENWNDAVDFF